MWSCSAPRVRVCARRACVVVTRSLLATRPASPPTHRKEMGKLFGYSPVPCGVAMFPREIFRAPRNWIRARYNLQQVSGAAGRRVRRPTVACDGEARACCCSCEVM